MPRFSPNQLLAAQQQTDPCIGEVLLAVQQHKPVESIQVDHPDIRHLKREWDKLSVEQDLLYRTLRPGFADKAYIKPGVGLSQTSKARSFKWLA